MGDLERGSCSCGCFGLGFDQRCAFLVCRLLGCSGLGVALEMLEVETGSEEGGHAWVFTVRGVTAEFAVDRVLLVLTNLCGVPDDGIVSAEIINTEGVQQGVGLDA